MRQVLLQKALPTLPISLIEIVFSYHNSLSHLKCLFLNYLRKEGFSDEFIRLAVSSPTGVLYSFAEYASKLSERQKLRLGRGLWYDVSTTDFAVYLSLEIPGFGGGGYRNITLFGDGREEQEHVDDPLPSIARYIKAIHEAERAQGLRR